MSSDPETTPRPPKCVPAMSLTKRREWRQVMSEFIYQIDSDVLREQMEFALRRLKCLDEGS